MPSKQNKKSKGKKKPSVQTDNGTDAQRLVDGSPAPSSSCWTATEECAYYAKFGCHIANIASQLPTPKSPGKKNPAQPSTCSQYNEMYSKALNNHPWLLGIERFDPSDYNPQDLECIPEIGLDDGNNSDSEYEDNSNNSKCMTLTLTNIKNVTNICFVTVWDVDLCGGDGQVLQSGWNEIMKTRTNNDDGAEEEEDGITAIRRKCTTFIVLCPPRTFVHLCYLATNQYKVNQDGDKVAITSWSQVDIENDIQPWSRHENIIDEYSTTRIHFPFKSLDVEQNNATHDTTSATTSVEHKMFQCIQSENGQLTHFFHGNYHAIDFACPIGTPLYSPIDGVVVDVHDCTAKNTANAVGESLVLSSTTKNTAKEVSGIASTNLFHWNSIMIRSNNDDNNNNNPLYIEYVHIQSNSCTVKPGEHVSKGQLICKSGSVGFSPTPHLHLGAYRSGEDGAASVRVRFECFGKDGESFLPVAGCWYDECGLVRCNEESG